jgi:hypothetical protein
VAAAVAAAGREIFSRVRLANSFAGSNRAYMGARLRAEALGRQQGGARMRETITVTIPHRLGKEEALRRIKNGIGEARTTFASVLTIKEETWNGDTLAFRVNALAQEVAGTIAVAEDRVKLDVELPWLLAKLAKIITPAIEKEGTLMLEKK